MNIRKNQARLSTAEKTAFVNAILQLKTATPSQMGLANRYDDYVQIHMDSMMLRDGSDRVPGWAHRGPAFGPWHRALLRNLELDLQDAAKDPAITLPYWDWTVNQTADPAAGSPWTDDFMGRMDASTDIVNSGPFRQGNSVLNVLEAGTNESFLRRALGRGQFQPNQPPFPIATLPTSANVSTGKHEVPYDSAPWARERAGTGRVRFIIAFICGWVARCYLPLRPTIQSSSCTTAILIEFGLSGNRTVPLCRMFQQLIRREHHMATC